MRKYRRSIWESRFRSIMLSSVLGLAAAFAASAAFSGILFIMGDISYAESFAKGSLAVGGFVGSFICGKHRRRHGAAEGALCGLVMYTVLAVSGVVITGAFCGIKKLLLLAVSGIAGGIIGVNTSGTRLTESHISVRKAHFK